MHDPNRQKEFMELMQGSIAPLPEAPQFVPMQPMEVAPIQDDGPSPLGSAIGQLGTSFINRPRNSWKDAGKRLGKFKMPTIDL